MKTKKNRQQNGKVFHWMIRSVPKINTLKVKKMNSKEKNLYSLKTSKFGALNSGNSAFFVPFFGDVESVTRTQSLLVTSNYVIKKVTN